MRIVYPGAKTSASDFAPPREYTSIVISRCQSSGFVNGWDCLSYWIYPPTALIFGSFTELLWDDIYRRRQPPCRQGVAYGMSATVMVCLLLCRSVDLCRPDALVILRGRWVRGCCVMAFQHRPGKRIQVYGYISRLKIIYSKMTESK